MIRSFIIIFVLCVSACNLSYAQDQLKLMFYNVLNFPSQAPASRIQNLVPVLDDYAPHLFMACEINDSSGAESILTILQNHNSNFLGANFVNNTSDDTSGDFNDLQNMLYYDSSKLILESQHEVTTIFRDFNHYVLRLNTTDAGIDPVRLDVFVAHLKASSGDVNENYRLQMVEGLENYLNSLPADSNVILAGDLNLYSNQEPAYQELTDTTNHITFVDPVDREGNWHNNSNYLDVFTQSTRTTSGLGGAAGGFDDRFDFILVSENMMTNPEVHYADGTYQSYGNNNNPNCFNSSIQSNDCSGSQFSTMLREALHDLSDHLPVTMTLNTSSSLSLPSVTLEASIQFLGTNVVTNSIQLKIPATFAGNEIYVYDTLGQMLAKIPVERNRHLNVNVEHYSDGIYYIRTTNVSSKPLKFIKY